MLIWTSKVEKEDKVTIEYMGKRSWKYEYRILEWLPSSHKELILLNKRHFYSYEKNDRQEWIPTSHPGFFITLSKWKWGQDHGYYDGPMCMRYFGWIHIEFRNFNCKKCC